MEAAPLSISSGLTSVEAAARLAANGFNEIEKPRTRSLWMIARQTLREPMFLLLLAGAGLYLAIGDLGEGLFLVAGAGVSIGLVIYQEARSEGALRALRDLAQPFARVVRDGEIRRMPARELVLGDLLLVSEGDRLPADAKLVSGDVLSIDESLLSGESAPVAHAPAGNPAGPATASVLAGTMVVRGNGVAVVTATGGKTRFGQIGASLSSSVEELTPLQRTARRLVGMLAVVAVAFATLVLVAYGTARGDWLEGALSAITVAIALLPEEFPMVLAIFLAIGAWRLARHNVLVRRSAVIEALGGATLLCVDKTGTITRNQMELERVWADGRSFDLGGGQVDAAVSNLLRVAVMASAKRSADPMDRAILARAELAESLATGPDRTWPLRPERVAVIQLWRTDAGQIAAAKGAPETIFRLCRLPDEQIARLHIELDHMAAGGLRVLGVASAAAQGDFPDNPDQAEYRFEGLLGFLDPLRSDAAQAIEEAKAAGIGIVMITGDYPATALAIARQAGIDSQAGVVTGPELAALEDVDLQQRIRSVRVFARVAPEQKLRLVRAYRALGEIVVMSGDGVNDAPALQAAHIGIAMGKRGSDVAREAADIVLLDDSFASIVGGVRLGRRIFANLRKALTFITAVHIPLAGLALLPVMLGWPPLFLPMHVVLLELVIDPVCSLVFEAEPSEARAMKRPPRHPGEALFGPAHIAAAAIQGFVVFLAISFFYAWALDRAPENEARAAAFAALVAANLFLALADSSGGRAGLFDRVHTAFWTIFAVTFCVLGIAIYQPASAGLLHMAPPAPEVLTTGLAIAALAGGWPGLQRIVTDLTAGK